MSADNGIYIAAFPKKDGGLEWRVIHAQGIEELGYYLMGSKEEAGMVVDYFLGSLPYESETAAREVAFEKAERMEKDGAPLEYGIRTLGTFPEPFETYVERARR